MISQRSLFEIEGSIDFTSFSRIFTPEIKTVIHTIRKYGFDIRVVGGAVRDFLLGKAPRDVDFATDADPAELIFIFDLEGIVYDAGGIQHGTIKAVFGENKIDVTSISYKLNVHGNTISIKHPVSWQEDSLSRDITINSMSVDMNGVLHDYQNGTKDLKEQRIKFCPGAQEKIKQDPMVLLRWFKALAFFANAKYLKKDLEIVTNLAYTVRPIRHDKKTQLLLASLVQNANQRKIFGLMCQTGVGQQLDISCS
jgi:tRNA nucleotidyltransferase (CCA-adding enzyme)